MNDKIKQKLKSTMEQSVLTQLEKEYNESLNPEILHKIEDEIKKIIEEWGDVEIF